MRLFIIGLVMLLTTGCAAMKSTEQSPMLELVVRASAGRVLHENPTWAQPTYEITRDVIFVVESGLYAQLQELDKYIIERLPDALLPEEQALAIVLIGTLKESIIADLERRNIKDPEEIQVRVVQILSWINQTAAFQL